MSHSISQQKQAQPAAAATPRVAAIGTTTAPIVATALATTAAPATASPAAIATAAIAAARQRQQQQNSTKMEAEKKNKEDGSMKTKIATYNMRGKMKDAGKRKILFDDFVNSGIDVACLQETKLNKDEDFREYGKGRIINIAAKNERIKSIYGMGFYISEEWCKTYEGAHYVTDRIAIAHFKINKKKKKNRMTIINVYSPTDDNKKDRSEVIEFYKTLTELVEEEKRISVFVIIAGDFNASVGSIETAEDKAIMGGNTNKQKMNENGRLLRNFLHGNNLYLANTHFKKSIQSIQTWKSQIMIGKANTGKKRKAEHDTQDKTMHVSRAEISNHNDDTEETTRSAATVGTENITWDTSKMTEGKIMRYIGKTYYDIEDGKNYKIDRVCKNAEFNAWVVGVSYNDTAGQMITEEIFFDSAYPYLCHEQIELQNAPVTEIPETEMMTIRRTIDYIVIPWRMRRMLIDAKSYNEEHWVSQSDHYVVVMTIKFHINMTNTNWQKGIQKKKERLDISVLAADRTIRDKYEEQINQGRRNAMMAEEFMRTWPEEEGSMLQQHQQTMQEKYDALAQTLKTAAEKILPLKKKVMMVDKQVRGDEALQQLIRLEHIVRKQRRFIKKGDVGKLQRSKAYQNELKNQIEKRVLELRRTDYQQIIQQIAENKNGKKAMEAIKVLEKMKKPDFKLTNKEGKIINSPELMVIELQEFYEGFFNSEETEPIDRWKGLPQPLEIPITVEEIMQATADLSNNRSPGPDNIPAEHFKYAGDGVAAELVDILNGMFAKHEPIKELVEGNLKAINKSTQRFTAKDTRPITLLNIIRKIMANIILGRLQNNIDHYVRANQTAYRKGRSTAEIAWAAQYMKNMLEKYADTMMVMQIDLSKAFDCMNRSLLLRILEENNITDKDTQRMIQYLLAETSLRVKVDEDTVGPAFKTSIGAPQGDSLSPILFIIYQEYIMREYEKRRPGMNLLSLVWSYADDTSYLEMETNAPIEQLQQWAGTREYKSAEERVRELLHVLPEEFALCNTKMNQDKTETFRLTGKTIKNAALTFIKSHVNVENEVARRTGMAIGKMSALKRTMTSRIDVTIKSMLYNVLIKPILTYNLHALPMRRRQIDQLNSLHRRHLRVIIGRERNQQDVSCEEVYRTTGQRPIEVDIVKARWTLLGHISRQPENYLANEMMALSKMTSFKANGTTLKRKKNGNIPGKTLRMDLVLQDEFTTAQAQFPEVFESMATWPYIKQKLLSGAGKIMEEKKLKTIRRIASNRKDWIKLVQIITVCKNKEWYNKYCHEHEVEPKREYLLETPKNKKRQRTFGGAEQDLENEPDRGPRKYRYQEDNPKYINKT